MRRTPADSAVTCRRSLRADNAFDIMSWLSADAENCREVGMGQAASGRRRHVAGAALAAAALVLALPSAWAQPSPVAAVAGYQGPDREQKLIDGAKREKELTLYASIPPEDIAVLAAAFDRKYGVKVKVWRADSESILQRILSEARGRRYEVDIAVASSSGIEPLYRENMLLEVKSPYLADLIPEAIATHRQWVAVYLSTIVQAYNTNLIPAESLPKTYHDLLRPQWHGKLGIEAEDFDWFAQVVLDLGEAQGLKLFRDIVAANGISVRKGHSLLAHLVSAGEVPLALTVYGFIAEQAKRKGAPLDWFAIPPMIARPTAEALAKNAPHPNAAVLFYDFLLSDAQPILAGRQFFVVSRKIESAFKSPIKLIDSTMMLDQSRKWQELYQRTIVGPSR
jgi:iron(III) transport system substrate-binding protein